MKIPTLAKPLPPTKKKAECLGLFYTYTRKRWRTSSAGLIWTESLRLMPSRSCPGCYVCRRLLAWIRDNPESVKVPTDSQDWAHLRATPKFVGGRKFVEMQVTRDLPPRRRKDLKTVKKGV